MFVFIQHHTVFTALDIEYVLKSGIVLLKVALAFLGLLWFHKDFKSFFFYFVKSVGIFIKTALNNIFIVGELLYLSGKVIFIGAQW